MRNLLMMAFLSCLIQSAFAQEGFVVKEKKDFVLGTSFAVHSNVLGEDRALNIYFPEGYFKNDSIKYPVIYLLDGSADEDFIHICGLVQFLNFSWVNLLPPSIVVGIGNVDRRRDFTFPTTISKDKKDFPTTGGSGKFIDFIEKELQPFIDKSFKTSRLKTIIGESLGGLLATEILFTKPMLFTDYIIVSPSLWWDKESLLLKKPAVLQKSFNKNVAVYVAVGNEGKVMVSDNKKLVNLIKEAHKPNLFAHFQYFGHDNHATIMHKAAYDGLVKLNKPAH